MLVSKGNTKLKIPGLPDSAFYCDQISTCNNPINPNYRVFFFFKKKTQVGDLSITRS